jgi:hypothetical protein
LSKSALLALLVCQNVEAKDAKKEADLSKETPDQSMFDEFIDTIIMLTGTIKLTDVPDSETVPDPQ